MACLSFFLSLSFFFFKLLPRSFFVFFFFLFLSLASDGVVSYLGRSKVSSRLESGPLLGNETQVKQVAFVSSLVSI